MSIAAALIPLLIIAGSYLYYTSTKDKWVEISVAYGDKNTSYCLIAPKYG